MKNNGLFSSLFIEELKDIVKLDDAAQGRMATLAQTWRSRNPQDTQSLWESFLKQALSYLEFVPPGNPTVPGIYPLFEDWAFKDSISVLYLAPPGSNIDNTSVGSFYPAKLLAQLKDRKLNWGILTNGSIWRLYSIKSSKPYEDYVELPLEQALEGSDEAEYGLFERFFHKDSFIAEGAEIEQQNESVGVYKCRLDRDREQSEQVLEDKVKTPFLAQVDEVLQYICNGFIFDTKKSGEEYTEEERADIFESAVKLIYRCLFLFYAEARRLLPSDPDKADLYQRHSIQALCKEARKFRWGERRDTDQYDLWKHLKGLINAVNDGDPEYGIMGYNGGLFDDEEERFLGQHQLRNDFMCRALYLLAFVEPYNNEQDEEYAIPYEDLEVRHLGELYENILEYTVLLADADRIRRRTKKGVEMLLASQTTKNPGDTLIKKGDVYFGESALERKQTGSYYTPESLVRFLNEKNIIQPLSQNFEQDYRKRFDELLEQARKGHDFGTRRGAAQSASALVERFVEEVVLNFKVCDPAMGSGHFLVDAANQMAGLVVALLEEVPHVEGMRVSATSRPNDWRRRITRHCIYGVDLNPLAVNLSKLSLWLNCFAIEHRLTFLDHHVRCGNSLIGIRSIDKLKSIPERKKESNKKKDPQKLLFDYNDLSSALAEASQGIASITQINEDDTDRQKNVLDEALEATSHLRPLADLFTAYLMDPEIQPDDYKDIFERIAKGMSIADTLNPALHEIFKSVEAYRDRHHFFHWPLEFPDIFGQNASVGFLAITGNPPWDTWSPKTQEFFSNYDPEFRNLSNKEAKKRIEELCRDINIENAWQEYQSRFYEAAYYFQNDLDYAHQDIKPPGSNLYKLFLERDYLCLNSHGRLGLIVPSGFYTDSATKGLRRYFIDARSIHSIYCFENRFPTVFKSVDGRFKFITVCIVKSQTRQEIRCAFMQHDPETLPLIEKQAILLKPKDILKFSPDSFSITEFNAQRDVDIAGCIYADYPLLGESNKSLPWTFPLLSVEFNMTHQSSMFQKDIDGYVLYEGKMINQFDHLFAENNWVIKAIDAENYLRSKELYRIGRNSVLGKSIARLKSFELSFNDFRFGMRAIAASTNERAIISTVLPANVCTGHSIFTSIPWRYFNGISIGSPDAKKWRKRNYSYTDILLVVALFNSFTFDWLTRMKVTTNLCVFIMNQLPMPRLTNENFFYKALIGRTLRLICTANEFSPFWEKCFSIEYKEASYWYPASAPIDAYGPAHEQNIRNRIRDEAKSLSPEWGHHCGVHDRIPDRRDTGDRAQLRAEIDAYVAHLYSLSRDDFAYILDTFPVLKKKEGKAFGEFMSKRKCLEEYDRIKKVLNGGRV